MTIQRIDHPASSTHGWQARVYIGERKRLTRFVADDVAGGYWPALARAEREMKRLERIKRRMR